MEQIIETILFWIVEILRNVSLIEGPFKNHIQLAIEVSDKALEYGMLFDHVVS